MTLEERVRVLELRSRRWRSCTVGLLLILGVCVTVAASLPQEKVHDLMRAKRIEVVDKSGKATVTILGEDRQVPMRGGSISVHSFATTGSYRVRLTAPEVRAAHWRNRRPTNIGDQGDTWTSLTHYNVVVCERDGEAYSRSELGAWGLSGHNYKPGSFEQTMFLLAGGRLLLCDEAGKRIAEMGDLAANTPFIAIYDSSGKKAGELRIDAKGNGEIELWNRTGKGRVIRGK